MWMSDLWELKLQANHHGYWELNLGPLERQCVLFITELSLQAQNVQFYQGSKIIQMFLGVRGVLLQSPLAPGIYV